MSVVTVKNKIYEVEPLSQWDRNQVLEIRGLSLARVPEIHFTTSAMSRAIVRNATMDTAGIVRVDIPNSLLQHPYTLNVYVCTRTGATFETLYKIEVPVIGRAQPEGYTLTNDQEVYSFEALENEVKNATLTAAQLSEKLDSEIEGIRDVGKANSVLTSGADGRLTNAGTPASNPAFLVGKPNAAPAWATAAEVAKMLGATMIEMGTYHGTGTSGESNPNRLSFNNKVVALLILDQQPNGINSINTTLPAQHAVFLRGCPTPSTNFAGGAGRAALVDWASSTSLSWYALQPEYQLNNNGDTYYYVAFTIKE